MARKEVVISRLEQAAKDFSRSGNSKVIQRSISNDFTGWKVYPRSVNEKDLLCFERDVTNTKWYSIGFNSVARKFLPQGDCHIYFSEGNPLIGIFTDNGHLVNLPYGVNGKWRCSLEEENIAFRYIQEGHGIIAGEDYIADMQDLCTLLREDCTWRDILSVPFLRRCVHGENRWWGQVFDEKIHRLLSASREERFSVGIYTPYEIDTYNVSTDCVRGLLNV